MPEAVAYRVTTPAGVVVISGDTRVCAEVEQLAQGADVLVHEAARTTAMSAAITGTVFETIFSYHADTVPLGGLAERAGGYSGRVSVGRDLMTLAVATAEQIA